MLFSEFKDWFDAQDNRLAGQPPDLKLWWELKARLEAVTGVVASSPASTPPTPAMTAQPSPSPRAEPEIEDLEPRLDLDPEPGDFRALSRAKDGGLSAEVVDALREQQADLRPRQRRA
jgi:hypothetical protein